MILPVKPFEDYKWRWAVLTPTESLNNPSVYLGVLRALRRHEGLGLNSPEVNDALNLVKVETHTHVDLVRSSDRNLIRNSGQYWKALNLLDDTRGSISLTPFGRKVADGDITKVEFAATAVKSLELPNRRIESAATLKKWAASDLRIKPLELILQILNDLYEYKGETYAYLTPNELIKVIVPLAGSKVSILEYREAIDNFRDGATEFNFWPNCAPESNDKRMVKEFLIFLSNYNFTRTVRCDSKYNDKYFLNNTSGAMELQKFISLDISAHDNASVLSEIRGTNFVAATERKKILTEITARPQQAFFRNKVMKAYQAKCVLTGVSLEYVLEAAHIVPVSQNGTDELSNGICLRSDVHLLFDTGNLRISPSGEIHLSEAAALATNYGKLPTRLDIPGFVNRDYLEWRWNYY
jgi:hypothetical protein